MKCLALVLVGCCLGTFSAGAALKADEAVVLYPALAWPGKDGSWQIDLQGMIYEPGPHPYLTSAFRKLLGFDGDQMNAAERALFASRVDGFVIDHERGKRLVLDLAGQIVRPGKSGPNGHFSRQFALESLVAERRGLVSNGGVFQLPVQIKAASGPPRSVPWSVHCVPATGWSVISDIDDTIKESHVRDRKALVRATFCQPFEPVKGMAAVYQEWAAAGLRFHYVSASPTQLYPALAEFIGSNRFPAGTFHLKSVRLKDPSILQLFGPQKRYKAEAIEPLLDRFPARQFVLVGDSGENDPEIYGELARAHRKQVRHIFIRNVTEEDETTKRYRIAFRGLNAEMWTVFTNPTSLTNGLAFGDQ